MLQLAIRAKLGHPSEARTPFSSRPLAPFRRKLLAKLLQLGRHHKRATSLSRVLAELFLMVLLGLVKRGRRTHLSDNPLARDARAIQFRDHLVCHLALRLTVRKEKG